MSSLFETRTGTVIKGALDGLAARHRTLAHNLANVETPGFQPQDVPFEAELRRVRDELAAHPDTRPSQRVNLTGVERPDPATGRADGNGVSIDGEVIRLAENTLSYESLAQAARLRGELLKSAISEGKK
jgi:flagellar basal-body rod protein FlgB